MRHLFLLCFLPACFIDAPTFHNPDAGADDVALDAGVDAMPANAELSTEQSPHNFGDVTTGELSATLGVTFRNTGTDPTGEITVSLGGANPGEFDIVDAGAGDCAGKTLAADETCIASARFAPGAAGAAAASLEVSADPGDTASVALSGNGLSPGALEITAGATLPFSTIEIQSSSVAQTLTVHNLGGTATPALETVVGVPSAYSTSNDTCHGAPLAGGASCSVDVVFNPAVVGSLPSQISVRESPSVGVAASATGTGTARLKVDKTGTGTIASSFGGLTCGVACTTTTVSFSQSPVTLTATDGGGFAFDGWTGACAAANPSTMCSVPLTAPLTTVGAAFVQVYTLDTSTVGAGTLSSSPSGISCGNGMTDCSESYETGTMVTLTASPDTDFEVFAWTGAAGCTVGMRMCTVTMSQARSVGVEFKQQYTLTVVPGGSGSGTITGGSISCPGTCSATLFSGSMLTLTESPGTAGTNSQMVFGGWSGDDCSGTGTTCMVTVDEDKTVDATFTLQHRLAVTIAGTGSGATSATGSFNCSSGTCTNYYDDGVAVTMSSLPTNGTNSYFKGWTSQCTGIQRGCAFTMSQPRAVTAQFDLQPGNMVFVSSVEYAANLGGVVAYDSACNVLASAVGINNPAHNGFIAWLSDESSLARDRIGASTRGFVRMDGLPFADDMASLLQLDAKVFYPIAHDDNGVDPGVVNYFSSSGTTGDLSTRHCQNWTTTSEDPNAPFGAWGGTTHTAGNWGEDGGPLFCAQTERILCMGKTKTAALAPTPVAGKLIFLTNTTFLPGVTSPDAACTASKPVGAGIVHALIATTAASGASKVSPAVSYVRPDGVLVGTGAQIVGGALVSGAWQTGNGTYLYSGFFSGAAAIGDVGTNTCSNWSVSSAATTTRGRISRGYAPDWWNSGLAAGCSNPERYLCVEE